MFSRPFSFFVLAAADFPCHVTSERGALFDSDDVHSAPEKESGRCQESRH